MSKKFTALLVAMTMLVSTHLYAYNDIDPALSTSAESINEFEELLKAGRNDSDIHFPQVPTMTKTLIIGACLVTAGATIYIGYKLIKNFRRKNQIKKSCEQKHS